jgi:hypothetical protein
VQGSVTVRVDAPASVVWDIVSDVTRIGELSPETFEAKWIEGATGPAVGARFAGHVRRNGRGPNYWTRCRVTVCEPERVFEFGVETMGKVLNTWRYDLTSLDGGAATEVTESFRLTPTLPIRLYWAVLGWSRGRTNQRGMAQTLARAKAIAERS